MASAHAEYIDANTSATTATTRAPFLIRLVVIADSPRCENDRGKRVLITFMLAPETLEESFGSAACAGLKSDAAQ
jgi:hypothetical protein